MKLCTKNLSRKKLRLSPNFALAVLRISLLVSNNDVPQTSKAYVKVGHLAILMSRITIACSQYRVKKQNL